ncbi:hypothetical protein INS49_004271 [Diaporthe citri]|uniref:uncharacterized protein n=1 Tax=Diaporthe citri TaxID=83186 RepID=UPI001C7F3565|nr:uncharacterized protein INS49_004271 [Diaporthe citri]KAG6355190.1 hypothetical protein INS49_004271 [Diaporthe citri]
MLTHQHSEVDKLAATRTKLEQALKQLAQKDRQIAALTEELAGLRRGNSPTNVADGFYTAPSDLEFDGDTNRNESMTETLAPSTPPYSPPPKSSMTICDDGMAQEDHMTETLPFIEDQGATQAAFNDRYAPVRQEKVCGDGGWTDTYCDPSPGGSDDGHLKAGDWKNDSAASWDNAPSSWGNEWSDSPGPAGASFQPGEPPKEKWRDSKHRPESKSWLHSLSFGKPAHTLSDNEYKDLLDLHVLPLTTRLEDDDWLNSDLGHVRVDDERLFRLLTRGRELAQKCLWSFMDKNRPDICQREFPGGWQQVKLEVSALLDTLRPFALSFRQNKSELARNALFAVVPLRHLTCHWNPGDLGWFRSAPRVVDGHLKNVQKVAIHIYDKECAAEARQLRDEARQAVQDTVSEIEALEPLFDEYEWKYHHQQMFEQIEYAKDLNTPDLFRYPEVLVVFRAAEAWSRHRSSSGEAFEEDLRLREDTNAVRNQQAHQGEENHANAGNKDDPIAEHSSFIRVLSRRNTTSSSQRSSPRPSVTAEEQHVVRRNSSTF